MQGRHAVRDAGVNVGPELNECRQDVRVVESRSHDDGTDEAELTSLVHVGPALVDQQTDHVVEAVAHGPVERRRTLVVLHVGVGAQTYQLSHCVLETSRDVRTD